MKKKLEHQFILKLKSSLFNLIYTGQTLFRYEDFLFEMLKSIRELSGASDVTLYGRDEWKQEFFVECSTNASHDLLNLPKLVSFQEINMLMQEANKAQSRFNSRVPSMNEHGDMLFLMNNGFVEGCVILQYTQGKPSNLTDSMLNVLADECSKALVSVKGITLLKTEKKRFKKLFHVTKKFHASMQMDLLLSEIIVTLKEMYPSFTYFLLLSHDYESDIELPIKDLDYNDENIAAMQAYVTGVIQFEDEIADKRSILYAPLMGNQGVYGVLQVIAADTLLFPAKEVEFIKYLANTAGSALENAQLYQQSQQLISELQMINETSHRLNSDLRLTETIKFMSEQIIRSFQAEEVGFILFSQEKEIVSILKGSTDFFYKEEAIPYIEFADNKIGKDKEAIFIGDLHVPSSTDLEDFKSIMAVPMDQTGELKGLALVLHHIPYYFSFDSFKLLQSLIHHSTLAFKNSLLREELEKLVVTDHLTKLYSRSYLDDKVDVSMSEDQEGTFILIDIDNFKSINDRYGHQVGDTIIIQLADIISKNIRGSDIGSRWGGEEMAVYLPNVPSETGMRIANRLVKKVNNMTDPAVTISCGVAYWNNEYDDNYTSLFKRADEGLYQAKNTGKNKVVFKHHTNHH
ncbi:sensor domain-containing diguanylate cyclase [Cytobacillus purgationiresistens]|uniref:Diguanylate cyclase (GGDEF)-like protein n=1 Tax=Cytobacillus purgationiresistens TaxID=863449 RepID=A0ABU0AMZ7_9BACI|nr:diguanylate cyclase [Cytobacillus purgationiresistens]MDQ0272121.1 diguanylate cyclase (GGDEF)-like protein [Cytobacillus purgationiresistens]